MWIIICLFVILLVGSYWLISDSLLSARMKTSRNNLRVMGLALHNYHDARNMLPASATVDEEGVPHHGWMYAIIPFIDSNPYFHVIDSNSPWNDEVNLPHTRIVLPIYLNPGVDRELSADGFGLTHYAGNSQLFQPNQFLKLEEITDGPGETLMVGEVNEGFQPWAKPGNTRDPALGLNKGPRRSAARSQAASTF